MQMRSSDSRLYYSSQQSVRKKGGKAAVTTNKKKRDGFRVLSIDIVESCPTSWLTRGKDPLRLWHFHRSEVSKGSALSAKYPALNMMPLGSQPTLLLCYQTPCPEHMSYSNLVQTHATPGSRI